MATHLVFGWRSAVLAVAAGQMLIVAAALIPTTANRSANRCLAALLVVIAGILTPDIIGFAEFYDAFPWLTFAPFACPLAVAPLLYLYSVAFTAGQLPSRFTRRLAPGEAQFVYQSISFCLPFAAKARWDAVSTPLVQPVITSAFIVGLLAYGVASLQRLQRYRAALADERSDDDRFAARWLSRTVAAMLALLTVRTLYEAYDQLVAPLDYFSAVGLYLIIAAICCFLAVEGWRHADRPARLQRLLTHQPLKLLALGLQLSVPGKR